MRCLLGEDIRVRRKSRRQISEVKEQSQEPQLSALHLYFSFFSENSYKSKKTSWFYSEPFVIPIRYISGAFDIYNTVHLTSHISDNFRLSTCYRQVKVVIISAKFRTAKISHMDWKNGTKEYCVLSFKIEPIYSTTLNLFCTMLSEYCGLVGNRNVFTSVHSRPSAVVFAEIWT
jgi:hypothetical protein